jgi:Ion channel
MTPAVVRAHHHGRMSARAPAALGMSRQPGEHWSGFAARVAKAFGLVLLLVILTYVLASVTPYRGWTAVLIVAVAAASASIGLVSAEARPWVVRSGAYLAALAVLFAIVNAAFGSSPLLGISALIQMLLFLVAAGAILRAVLTATRVGFRTILGAISVYMIFGLLFTFLYVALDRLQSGPFFGAGAHVGTGGYVFFSFTTLTTTGYGDLVPAAQPGRMFSGLEMLFGQIFLVTLIAGLVSLWQPGQMFAKKRSQ